MIPVGITPVKTGRFGYRHVKSNSSQTLDTSARPRDSHLFTTTVDKNNLDRSCQVSSGSRGSSDISMYSIFKIAHIKGTVYSN